MDESLIAALIGVGGSIVGTVTGVALGSRLSNKQNESNRLHSEMSAAEDREFYKAAAIEERRLLLARERLRFAEAGYAEALGAIESGRRNGDFGDASSAVARIRVFAPQNVHGLFVSAMNAAWKSTAFHAPESSQIAADALFRNTLDAAEHEMRAHLGELAREAVGGADAGPAELNAPA